MIKYFHELSEKEYNTLFSTNITFEQLAVDYPQPTWCGYPNATDGPMGCWGLFYQDNKDREHCKNCECYIGSGIE
jgi:hypothetical protein